MGTNECMNNDSKNVTCARTNARCLRRGLKISETDFKTGET